MASQEADARIYKITGLPDGSIFTARESFPNSAIRKVLDAELDRAKEEVRRKLETCAPEELKRIQGELAGLERAAGIIRQQKN
jgi:hypothetical protein